MVDFFSENFRFAPAETERVERNVLYKIEIGVAAASPRIVNENISGVVQFLKRFKRFVAVLPEP